MVASHVVQTPPWVFFVPSFAAVRWYWLERRRHIIDISNGIARRCCDGNREHFSRLWQDSLWAAVYNHAFNCVRGSLELHEYKEKSYGVCLDYEDKRKKKNNRMNHTSHDWNLFEHCVILSYVAVKKLVLFKSVTERKEREKKSQKVIIKASLFVLILLYGDSSYVLLREFGIIK